MSKRTDFLATTIFLFTILFAASCSKYLDSTAGGNSVNSAHSMNENAKPIAVPAKSETPIVERQKIEKADFTLTVRELVDEFMREGSASEELKKKYAGKNIVVTGRVTMFSFEPNGTAPPYVVLSAPETESGVTCYIGNSGETARNIRKDKNITMQGLMSEFPMSGTSPSLQNCFVLS